MTHEAHRVHQQWKRVGNFKLLAEAKANYMLLLVVYYSTRESVNMSELATPGTIKARNSHLDHSKVLQSRLVGVHAMCKVLTYHIPKEQMRSKRDAFSSYEKSVNM